MISQQDWLLNELLIFYQNREYLEIIKKIINREFIIEKSKSKSKSQSQKISIRIVNWFVTNYAKQHFTVYEIPKEMNTDTNRVVMDRFFVWTRFRSAEDGYSKELFDPYCRKDRIMIPYDEHTHIVTTIGQLNFFKWAIVNKVIDYIMEHYEEITRDMNIRLNIKNKHSITEDSITSTESTSTNDSLTSSSSNSSNTKTRKKREELSVSACLSIRKEFVASKITF
jgi:hypothetical protein